MIVAKFGGAVLNGAEGLRRVVEEIRRLPKPVVVVVSAFADITNRLERLARTALAQPAEARELLDDLVEYHRAIAHQTLSQGGYYAWLETIEPYVTRLQEVAEGLAIVRELSPRTLDLVVHFGERFSSALVLALLADSGKELRSLGVSALDLVITDAAHRYARPDLDLTRERVEQRLRPALHTSDVVVTEGYIARSNAGQATTMGRESSNYSATLFGGLLGADEVRIYTAFPGILTADPAFLPEARTLPRLSYGMANTLAELGAKVLHPRTVMPVERAGIRLVIASIGGNSTTIGPDGDSGRSIACLPHAGLISVETETASAGVEEFLRVVARETPIIWYQRFRRRLQVIVAGDPPSHPPFHLIGEHARGESIPVAVVSAVQEGVFDGGDLECFFGAIEGDTPRAMQGGIESHAISVALDREAAVGAVRELHRRFVETVQDAEQWQEQSA